MIVLLWALVGFAVLGCGSCIKCHCDDERAGNRFSLVPCNITPGEKLGVCECPPPDAKCVWLYGMGSPTATPDIHSFCVAPHLLSRRPSSPFALTAKSSSDLLKGYCTYPEQYNRHRMGWGRVYRHCCDDADFCNNFEAEWKLMAETWPHLYGPSSTPAPPTTTAPPPAMTVEEWMDRLAEAASLPRWAVAVVFFVVAGLLFVVFFAFGFLMARRYRWGDKKIEADSEIGNDVSDTDSDTDSDPGPPITIQSTVAAGITIERTIGRGRFGTVCLATWRGGPVAVKIFASRDSMSWARESDIYSTAMLHHENLLGFIASDTLDTGTQTEFWLIMDYHHLGSLYDYLNIRPVSQLQLMAMMYSIANGLTHLHLELIGTNNQDKPSIAHRDLKSKNILVKRNGECCIADLGLAVRFSSDSKTVDIPANEKVGTIRYMPPEILNGTLDSARFESFTRGDIYSCGLVLWEILNAFNRAKVPPRERHRLPYFDTMPDDPSLEEARAVVCEAGVRPELPAPSNAMMSSLHTLLRECWAADAVVRLTSLRVKKKLAALSSQYFGVPRS
ncbi:TGF-beta receptor type-1 [Hypsibius exemplaris]|uniref:receptor protein serine/threonine kinase n=1 Tax=Hypsibius exemplaris TaxID=2072580 RepID=A0A1W0X6Z8_HYPEX|nr:TGF-beta receptor type-1 [Hypsibius exemplaris]